MKALYFLFLMVLLICTVSANCIEPGQACDREAFGFGCCSAHYCDFFERVCKPFVKLFGADQPTI